MEEDDRQFFREILLRNDRRWEAIERRFERRHQETMAQLSLLQEKSDRTMANGDATLQALLRVLDRLDGGGGAAPAG